MISPGGSQGGCLRKTRIPRHLSPLPRFTCLVVSKNAPNSELAYAFTHFLTDPANAAADMESTSTTSSPNQTAYELISPEFRKTSALPRCQDDEEMRSHRRPRGEKTRSTTRLGIWCGRRSDPECREDARSGGAADGRLLRHRMGEVLTNFSTCFHGGTVAKTRKAHGIHGSSLRGDRQRKTP